MPLLLRTICMQSAPSTPLPTSSNTSKGKISLKISSSSSSCTSPCRCILPWSALRFISSASFFCSSNCSCSSFILSCCSVSFNWFFSCSWLRICSESVRLSSCNFFCSVISSSASLFFSPCSFCKNSNSFFLAVISFSSLSLLLSSSIRSLFSKSAAILFLNCSCISVSIFCFSCCMR